MDTVAFLATGIATAFSGWNFVYVLIGAFVGT